MTDRPENEEHQLEELASSSKTSFDDEQEQGLLSDRDSDSDDERDREDDISQVHVRRPRSRRTWIFMAAAVIVSLVTLAAFFMSLNGMSEGKHGSDNHSDSGKSEVDTHKGQTHDKPDVHKTPDKQIIKSNDYILDTNWDFQAKSQRREYTFTVRDQEHNPDGIYRPMILVNNQYPGPLIECNDGDTLVVHVENKAQNATSIHWHGLYQTGTPHMDGTVGITQCPIASRKDFTYEFKVSGQSGTYWWHAHQGVQSSDGVHGPLIIHSKKEKELQEFEYTSDRVLLVSDHYHDLSSGLLWQYLAPDVENAEPVPYSALINGRTKRNCEDFPDRKCDSSSPHLNQPDLDLEPNSNHRIRIINVGAFAEFQVQIDEHELAVTEVDGTDVHPISYHRININPAQRYSVIVNTNVTKADSFWLRARMLTGCFTDPPKTVNADAKAIVRYHKKDGNSDKEPTSKDWEEQIPLECRDMNTTELTPVEVIKAPDTADAFFYVRSNFEIGDYRLSRGFFNATSWRADVQSPSLLRAIDGVNEKNASFTAAEVTKPVSNHSFVNDAAFDISREMVIQTTGTQTIDILVSNFDDGTHPLHLHGYKYFILAQGHGYPAMKSKFDGMTRENLEPLYETLDLSNPLRRDTASVEAFGWILFRIVADNPGAWAFHCHVTWHAEAGLMMQLLAGTDKLAKLDVPQSHRDLCAADGLDKGMAPHDEVYHDIAK